MNVRALVLCVVSVAAAAGCASSHAPALPPRPPEIAAALDEAGANRGEIERFLARYERGADREAAEAARFLVANMPGKGHVLFAWRDAKGGTFDFDPLAHGTFAKAQAALDAIERERGPCETFRAQRVSDLETLSADFLSRHLDRSLATWRALPDAERPPFATFLDFILPYRGSEEPAEDWLGQLHGVLDGLRASLPSDAPREALWRAFQADLDARARFDEVYYLHPTDQGFAEISATGLGRCEDLSNLQTWYARAFGRATACDYTPAWGHRDNNHAWTVDLDARGEGRATEYAHAPKVYRKTFSIQPGLEQVLPPGREPPNRWVANRCNVDVTAQYGNCTDLELKLDRAALGDERAVYLCVFNGGEWVAIAWTEWLDLRNTPRFRGTFSWFESVGRGLLYLPIAHDGKRTIPVGHPLVTGPDGRVRTLQGTGPAARCVLTATMPELKSVDTGATTPVSRLTPGATYTLFRWDGEWKTVEEFVATAAPRSVQGLASDGLYWLVEEGGRKLERPFTIEDGRQRFW